VTKASEMAIRALMQADGIPAADIDLAIAVAEGGEWVSTPQLCANLKVKRWFVWGFCRDHGIEVRVRAGRGGNLIKAREFFRAWQEVNGVSV